MNHSFESVVIDAKLELHCTRCGYVWLDEKQRKTPCIGAALPPRKKAACLRRITLFSPSGELLLSEVYDPTVEPWEEVLVRCDSPDVVNMVRQSRAFDADGAPWLWDNELDGDVCNGYLAQDEREQSSSLKERNTTMAKKKPSEPPPPAHQTEEPKKPPAMKIETFTRDLKVSLTAAEVAERADRAAKLLEDRDRTEGELKAHATHVKGQISTMESEMRQLSSEVRSKITYREVECERRFIFTTGCVQEVRIDTGEVLNERAMTEKEKQRDLPFERPVPPPPKTELVEQGWAPKDTAAE